MGLESGVDSISDLNEAWPLLSDPRSDGDNHIRNVKIALKSILTNPSQIPITLPQFVDAESPGGYTPSGVTLVLSHSPSPGNSLILTRDGLVMTRELSLPPTGHLSYTLVGPVITLAEAILPSPIPGPGGSFIDQIEVFQAWYRW